MCIGVEVTEGGGPQALCLVDPSFWTGRLPHHEDTCQAAKESSQVARNGGFLPRPRERARKWSLRARQQLDAAPCETGGQSRGIPEPQKLCERINVAIGCKVLGSFVTQQQLTQTLGTFYMLGKKANPTQTPQSLGKMLVIRPLLPYLPLSLPFPCLGVYLPPPRPSPHTHTLHTAVRPEPTVAKA